MCNRVSFYYIFGTSHIYNLNITYDHLLYYCPLLLPPSGKKLTPPSPSHPRMLSIPNTKAKTETK